MNLKRPGLLDEVELVGNLERIVFHNEDNGYTVLRLLPESKKDTVTVVGHMARPNAGLCCVSGALGAMTRAGAARYIWSPTKK